MLIIIIKTCKKVKIVGIEKFENINFKIKEKWVNMDKNINSEVKFFVFDVLFYELC